MSFDLKKLAQDVLAGDVELQVLALQTLLRMDRDLVEAPPELLGGLRGDLARLANGSGDARFFARQCLDHIDRVRAAAERAAMTAAGPPLEPTGEVPARLTQRLKQAQPVLLEPAALARIAAEKRVDARPHVLALLAGQPDSESAAGALSALAAIGETADAAAVTPYLRHRDARVRANAVEAVEALAPAEQRVALLAALAGDPENRVRANALKALGALGEDRVWAGIAAMVSSNAIGTRASGVYALRHIRGDRAIELLWKAARDPSEIIRLRVVEALKDDRHPQAVEILRKLANDIDISIAEAAYAALTARTVAATAGEAAPPDLQSADQQVQLRALKEIEAHAKKESRGPVVELLGRSADQVVIAQGIMALGKIGDAGDLPLLERFLLSSNDRVRANAVEAYDALATAEAAVRALTPLADDPDNRVRANAIRALADHGVAGLEPKVEAMLKHAEVPMRLSAAWCAGHLEPTLGMRLLARAARDSDADVRRKVVDSLARMPAGPDVAKLLRELAADPAVAVSQAARDLGKKVEAALPPRKEERDTLKMKLQLEETPPPPPSKPSHRTLQLEMPELAAVVTREKPASRPGRTTTRVPAVKAPVETLAPAVDALYEKLDAELEAMGRKLYQLELENQISEPVFSKPSYHIKRFADLLRKREAASRDGFLARLPWFRPGPDPATLELEADLAEEYRKLGETAIELYHGVERTFPGVQEYYERVEALLKQVKTLTAKDSTDGNQPS